MAHKNDRVNGVYGTSYPPTLHLIDPYGTHKNVGQMQREAVEMEGRFEVNESTAMHQNDTQRFIFLRLPFCI